MFFVIFLSDSSLTRQKHIPQVIISYSYVGKLDRVDPANGDMLTKLTENLSVGDSVLITEGSYRNLHAKVLKVHKNSKTADLRVKLASFFVTATEVPFNWFSKRNASLIEESIHLLKSRKNMTEEDLIERLNTTRNGLKRCVQYLKDNNLVSVKKGRKYTSLYYNF